MNLSKNQYSKSFDDIDDAMNNGIICQENKHTCLNKMQNSIKCKYNNLLIAKHKHKSFSHRPLVLYFCMFSIMKKLILIVSTIVIKTVTVVSFFNRNSKFRGV